MNISLILGTDNSKSKKCYDVKPYTYFSEK